MNEANKTEQILSSLDQVSRAEAPPFLSARIRNMIRMEPFMPIRWGWRLAFVMTAIVILNLLTVKKFYLNKEKDAAAAVASEYAISLPQTDSPWY